MSLDNATSYSWRVMAFNSKGNGAWSQTWSFTTVAKPIGAIQTLRPTNDAANVSTSPTFVWQADSNAASYQLQLSEDGFDSMYEQTSTTDTSATVGGLAHRSTYSWRVRGLNDGVVGAWSEPFTFTTQPPSVSVPVILTPEQNADSVAIPTEFIWQADENAMSYQAELFTDLFTVKVFEQSLNDTSIVYTEMVADKGYLFRVRAVNAAGASRWSSVEFRTQAEFVRSITLSSPSDGSTDLSLSPTLSWNQDSQADSYTIQVSTDEFESFVVNESLTEASLMTPELEYNTEYSWRVRGTNSSGNGDWSEAWAFTTQAEPITPVSQGVLSAPVNGATDQELTPTLRWQADSVATAYRLEVSTDGFATTIQSYEGTETSHTLDSLAYETSYSWRVRATNEAGDGEWSEAWAFTTQVEPVGQITLSSPSNESTGVTLTPTLSWSEDANSESYTIQVSTDGFESFVVNESLTETSFTSPELGYNTEYSWRVRGTNTSGDGDWSEVWNFTTFSQLQTPTLLNPRDGQLDVGTATDFDWSDVENALGYNLEVSTASDMSTIVFTSDTISTSDYIITESLAQNQLHYWRVKAISNNPMQSSEWSKIKSFGTGVRTNTEYDVIPTDYSLNQNYPNPFNPITTIHYSLPVVSYVSLTVYNMLGQKVETLVDGVKSAGHHQVTFAAYNLSSGSYIYRLETGEHSQMRTMFLVK
jgi:fibronectin type 3 domain-containing protein